MENRNEERGSSSLLSQFDRSISRRRSRERALFVFPSVCSLLVLPPTDGSSSPPDVGDGLRGEETLSRLLLLPICGGCRPPPNPPEPFSADVKPLLRISYGTLHLLWLEITYEQRGENNSGLLSKKCLFAMGIHPFLPYLYTPQFRWRRS